MHYLHTITTKMVPKIFFDKIFWSRNEARLSWKIFSTPVKLLKPRLHQIHLAGYVSRIHGRTTCIRATCIRCTHGITFINRFNLSILTHTKPVCKMFGDDNDVDDDSSAMTSQKVVTDRRERVWSAAITSTCVVALTTAARCQVAPLEVAPWHVLRTQCTCIVQRPNHEFSWCTDVHSARLNVPRTPYKRNIDQLQFYPIISIHWSTRDNKWRPWRIYDSEGPSVCPSIPFSSHPLSPLLPLPPLRSFPYPFL